MEMNGTTERAIIAVPMPYLSERKPAKIGPIEIPDAFNKRTFTEMTLDRKPGCTSSVRAEYAGDTKAVKNIPARISR